MRHALNYKLSSTAVFRCVNDKLVLVELNGGEIFYFSPSAESFLSFFRRARSLSDYFEWVGLQKNSVEADYLISFCKFLLKKKILVKDPQLKERDTSVVKKESYVRPQFFKKAAYTIDQVSFACP